MGERSCIQPNTQLSKFYKFTMSAVKIAIDELIKKIKNKSIFKMIPIKQDKILEIRYSKKKDFNDKIVKNFLKRNF